MRIVTTQDQLLYDILQEVKALRACLEAPKQEQKAEEIPPTPVKEAVKPPVKKRK
jgi:hypothetical protein